MRFISTSDNIKEIIFKPDFTQRQKYDLCYLVGDWYQKWKDNLINSETQTHNLSKACEELCGFIISNVDKYELNENQLNFILESIIIWKYFVEDDLVICYKSKIHNFGSIKETLKIFICDEARKLLETLKNG